MFRQKPSLRPGQDLDTLPTYTIPEAANYLAIEPFTLFEWYSGPRPILRASGEYGESAFSLLSFRDIDEAYKVQLLRTKYEYSLQYIRKALIDAREESGSEHPLLTDRFIAFTHLAIVKPGRGRRARQMVPLGSEGKTPLYIPQVLDTWGKRIVADTRGNTKRIFPWRYAFRDEVSRPVLLDPQVLSGRLVVTGTRIPVSVLLKRSNDNEPLASIARDYGISTELIKKALAHVDDKKVA